MNDATPRDLKFWQSTLRWFHPARAFTNWGHAGWVITRKRAFSTSGIRVTTSKTCSWWMEQFCLRRLPKSHADDFVSFDAQLRILSRSNALGQIVIGSRAVLLFFVLTQMTFCQNQSKEPPVQPIDFSHKLHAGNLKLPCKMCHPAPDPGDLMTLPEASKCMECHSTIKTDSPAIRKLAAFAKRDQEIKWVRVYQIPTYVNFSHKTHIDKNVKCQDCHGNVPETGSLVP